MIKDTKGTLDQVMYSASHHTDNPLHSNELKEVIEKVNKINIIVGLKFCALKARLLIAVTVIARQRK